MRERIHKHIGFTGDPTSSEDLYNYLAKLTFSSRRTANRSFPPKSREGKQLQHEVTAIVGKNALRLALEGDFPISRRRIVAVARATFGATKEIPPVKRKKLLLGFTSIEPRNKHVKEILVDLLSEEQRKSKIEKFMRKAALFMPYNQQQAAGNEAWREFFTEVAEEAGYVAVDEITYAVTSNPEGFVKAATGVCESIDFSNVSCPLDCDGGGGDCDCNCDLS